MARKQVVQIDFYAKTWNDAFWVDVHRMDHNDWPKTTNKGYSPTMASARRLTRVLNLTSKGSFHVTPNGWSWASYRKSNKTE